MSTDNSTGGTEELGSLLNAMRMSREGSKESGTTDGEAVARALGRQQGD